MFEALFTPKDRWLHLHNLHIVQPTLLRWECFVFVFLAFSTADAGKMARTTKTLSEMFFVAAVYIYQL